MTPVGDDIARFQDPADSLAVQFGIDPDEWADAARDAYLTGGAGAAEANQAAQDAKRDLLETPYVPFVMHRPEWRE